MFSSLDQYRTKMFILATSIQHFTGGSIQGNWPRKKKKMKSSLIGKEDIKLGRRDLQMIEKAKESTKKIS